MKRNYFLLVGIVLIFFIFFALGSISAIGYSITNCTDLQHMADATGDYVLANDIDCSDTINWNDGAGFTPLYSNRNLDGQNYKISNLYINNTDAGIFRCSQGNKIIKNLRIENATIIIDNGGSGGILIAGSGCGGVGYIDNIYAEGNIYGGVDEYSGGLAGRIETNANLTNSHFSGYVEGVGGLVGQNDGLIVNCSSDAYVDGTNIGYITGGLVGWNFGRIINSSSSGTVIGIDSVGGLVGESDNFALQYPANISYSFSTSNVSGENKVGGLVGLIGYSLILTIDNSYATGSVDGLTSVGGLVGHSNSGGGTIINSYSIGHVQGINDTGALLGFDEDTTICINSYWNEYLSGQNTSACGTNLSNEGMIDQNNYTDWDFTNIWDIQTGSTPYLRFYPVIFFPQFFTDIIPPTIQITSPSNNINTLNTDLGVNYDVSDDVEVDSCWYSNDSYSINVTLPNCQNINYVIWSEGQHTVTIWVNDSSNNINSSSVSFRIFPTIFEYIQWGNESNLNVNSSVWWNFMNQFNLTHFVGSFGKLSINENWLISFVTAIINSVVDSNYVKNLGFYSQSEVYSKNETDDKFYPYSNPSNFYNESTLPPQSGVSFTYYNITNSDITTTNSADYNTTVLSLPITAGKKVSIECNLLVDSSATTTGIQLNSTVSGTSSRRQVIEYLSSAAQEKGTIICQNTNEQLLCDASYSTGTTTSSTKINIYTVQNTNGEFILKLKSEVSGSDVNVRAGSWCRSIET